MLSNLSIVITYFTRFTTQITEQQKFCKRCHLQIENLGHWLPEVLFCPLRESEQPPFNIFGRALICLIVGE
jgi:hypothetical protein